MRVLLVEDEKKTASFISKALREENFAVDVCSDGNDALTQASTTPFDAIVLDIMLPGLDGLGVVRRLRDRRVTTPVLLLSARGQVNERVEGLDAGADDYLAKPFALAELIARVRALGRRRLGAHAVILSAADLMLNTATRRVERAGKAIDLTPREYRLLEFLMRAKGRVCGRMAILENVWEYHFDPGTNLIDVCIKRLRGKIDTGFEIKLLHTIRGHGYAVGETQ
jgi:two-component system, OmpR family, response regulator